MLLRGGQAGSGWDESRVVQLLQRGGGISVGGIQCDNADSPEAEKRGEGGASGSCGVADVFGWSDSIARTVHG